MQQPGPFVIVRHHARAGRQRRLDPGGTVRPFSTAFFASSPAATMTDGFEVLVQLVMAAITMDP